jgi:1-deoxy-D-xylulose-5-phosphate synthase
MMGAHSPMQPSSHEPPDGSYPLLDQVNSPADVRALEPEQLPELCAQLRAFLLESVQGTGGHLGSNLGVVELTVALHRVFDFRRDRLVWDVSHQCYPHKVLTGRREGFAKLRRTGGMCGFTNPAESEYDLFHTGHAGTSISLGLGMAAAAALEEDPPHVVSVIGDASLGAGVAFEGLNYAGALGSRMLVVLNDNEWSISKSVGSLARYLSRIRSTRLVQRAGQETKNLIHAIPLVGPRLDKAIDDLGEVMRHTVVPGHVFEELGVTYVGPIDGHDVEELVRSLERVRQLDGVVVLHCLTEKGKGHPKAPEHPERVHAVKPAGPKKDKTEAPVKSAESSSAPKPVAFTKAFARALCSLAEGDMRIRALTAGMPSGTGLDAFAERFPGRFHDTGITEQHLLAMSAGMARSGLRPVAAIYSTFLQRGYDQVFQEIALQGLPVILALDRAGPVGQDGPTHNGVFDLAYLRVLPNMVLGAPRDETDMRRMLAAALAQDGPVALRFPRGNCPVQEAVHERERREMSPGKAEVLRSGGQVALWALGSMVQVALEAATMLETEGLSITVVDARWVKPLDEELLAEHARSMKHIVTLEDHQRAGGFGSAVLESCNRMRPARTDLPPASIKVLGIPDRFLEHRTTREEQLAALGLDAEGVCRSVQGLFSTQAVE